MPAPCAPIAGTSNENKCAINPICANKSKRHAQCSRSKMPDHAKGLPPERAAWRDHVALLGTISAVRGQTHRFRCAAEHPGQHYDCRDHHDANRDRRQPKAKPADQRNPEREKMTPANAGAVICCRIEPPAGHRLNHGDTIALIPAAPRATQPAPLNEAAIKSCQGVDRVRPSGDANRETYRSCR